MNWDSIKKPDESWKSKQYEIYTTEFDRECHARDLCRERKSPPKSENKIIPASESALLSCKVFAQNYVILMKERYGYVPSITFLLDNSGSLKWPGATYMYTLIKEIWKILEKEWVPLEILWYTTRTWKWGQTREKWLKAGRSRNPGRLCDIQHTIFKEFWETCAQSEAFYDILDTPWYLKENIDGEAIDWANNRLKKQGGKVKNIIHISDGAPVDDSTLSVNPQNILEEHFFNTLQKLQNDPTIKIHSVFLGEKEVSKHHKLPYDSHSFLSTIDSVHRDFNNHTIYYTIKDPVEGFVEHVFPKLLWETLEDIVSERKKKLLWILWADAEQLTPDDILSIARNFDTQTLQLLRDFGLWGIDVLLHISWPLQDINLSVLQMNLWIVKHSWKDFWVKFSKLLPFLARYTYHEHLDFIVKDNESFDVIVWILKNSERYLQATEGQEWQKSFFQRYSKLIGENRLDIELLEFLLKWKYIGENEVENLYIILQYGNLSTIIFLLKDLWISYWSIEKQRDILEFSDTKRLQENVELLKKYFIDTQINLESLRFSMEVNPLMLRAALQYGITDFKRLKKIKSLLQKEYTAQSEEELFSNIIAYDENSKFSKPLIYKVPVATALWLYGFHNVYLALFQSFENAWLWSWLLALYFLNKMRREITNSYAEKNKNINKKPKDLIFLKSAYKNFRRVCDEIVAAWYTNPKHFSPENMNLLKTSYEDMLSIEDVEIWKILKLDIQKIKLQYHVILLFSIVYIIPDFRHIKDEEIAEKALSYLQTILDMWPRYVGDNGFNYKFFLEQKSKLQWTFGDDFWSQEDKKAEDISTQELQQAYETLWIVPWLTEEEVSKVYRTLVKQYHPDRQWWNEEMLKFVNLAKEIIYRHRRWD